VNAHFGGETYKEILGKPEHKTQIAILLDQSLKARVDMLKKEKGYTPKDIFIVGVTALEKKKV
jgi:hypothetical protein